MGGMTDETGGFLACIVLVNRRCQRRHKEYRQTENSQQTSNDELLARL
jgi:hypothetical protein